MMGDVDIGTRKHENVPPFGPIQGHAFRLLPNDSVKESLKKYATVILGQYSEKECSSVFVMTAVGSLCEATLRLANASSDGNHPGNTNLIQENAMNHENTETNVSKSSCGDSRNDIKKWENKRFEVVSLVGTFSRAGACHLHISLSDEKGETIGGHLIEGTVFTTLEVVLGTIHGVEFSREFSESTGYLELVTRQLSGGSLKSKLRNILLPSRTSLSVIAGVCLGVLLAKRFK